MKQLQLNSEVDKRFDSITGEPIIRTTTWLQEGGSGAKVALLMDSDASKEYNSVLAAAPDMLEALEKIEKTLSEKHLGTENHTYELLLISDLLFKIKGV